MNLQLTTGREFSVRCCQCRKPFRAGEVTHGTAVYADLDGAPFADYYCAVCAGDARAAAHTLPGYERPGHWFETNTNGFNNGEDA
jgi:hypothetical protein